MALRRPTAGKTALLAMLVLLLTAGRQQSAQAEDFSPSSILKRYVPLTSSDAQELKVLFKGHPTAYFKFQAAVILSAIKIRKNDGRITSTDFNRPVLLFTIFFTDDDGDARFKVISFKKPKF